MFTNSSATTSTTSGGQPNGRRLEVSTRASVHDSRDEAETESENEQLNNHAQTSWIKMTIVDSSGGSAENGMSPMKIATVSSWAVNWLLLIVKIAVVIISSSKAVLAAMVDSAVDLVSQAVLSLAGRYMQKHSPDYPVGRSRLEALSVLACAFIMTMASIEVIQFSAVDIINGLNGNKPELDVGVGMYTILSVGIFFKLILFLYCRFVNKTQKNDMLEALAEDHFNDVLSNSAAMVTAAVAFNTIAWWVDPAGAIFISIVIIGRWIGIMSEQVKKIVGHTAPQDFIDQVEDIARLHDSRLAVDVTRAYHFGARYNVEMEVVLPGSMTVMESHDIALALQHKIEELADVERAFVHVDHQERDGLEHKVERELVKGTSADSVKNTLVPTSDPAQGQITPAVASALRSRSSRNEIAVASV
jgi:cation diffusion facilitator family transporter